MENSELKRVESNSEETQREGDYFEMQVILVVVVVVFCCDDFLFSWFQLCLSIRFHCSSKQLRLIFAELVDCVYDLREKLLVYYDTAL